VKGAAAEGFHGFLTWNCLGRRRISAGLSFRWSAIMVHICFCAVSPHGSAVYHEPFIEGFMFFLEILKW